MKCSSETGDIHAIARVDAEFATEPLALGVSVFRLTFINRVSIAKSHRKGLTQSYASLPNAILVLLAGLMPLWLMTLNRLTSLAPRLALDIRGEGVPLIFLHGIGGNRTNWQNQVAALSDQYRCVAFDFRGYGDSEDANEQFDFFDLVQDVQRVLDAIEAERCHLFGLSMGGLVAQGFYSRFPDRVLSLGLIGCRPGSAPVSDDHQRFAEERSRMFDNGDHPQAIAEALLPKLLGPSVTPHARDAIRDSLLQLRRESYRKVLQARVSIAPFLELETIAVPTLVVAGTHDQVAPQQQMEAIAAAIRQSVVQVMPQAGHLMNIEQPDRFNSIVRDFLTTTMDKP